MPPDETDHATITLLYSQSLNGNSTGARLTLNGSETEMLDDCLAQFTQFLQMMGFTYVTGLTAVTE